MEYINTCETNSELEPELNLIQPLLKQGCINACSIEENHSKSLKMASKKWVVLTIFSVATLLNAFQWIQYSAIEDKVIEYFKVDSILVNLTSLFYMILYALVIVAFYVTNNYGMRWSIIIGITGTMLGAFIKLISIWNKSFLIILIGQAIAAASQPFLLGIPPRLAAVWFLDDGRSTACAIGVAANQFGIALGFLIPTSFISKAISEDEMATGFKLVHIGVAVCCLISWILIVAVLEESPSSSSEPQCVPASIGTWEQVKQMFDINFSLLFNSYGINAGIFYTVSTLLNSFVGYYQKDLLASAGVIGVAIVIAGIVGSIVSGFVLTKTYWFKGISLVLYFFSMVFLALFFFILAIGYNIFLVYFAAILLGFVMTGYLPVGFEYATEITKGYSEDIASNLLNTAGQVIGIILIFLFNVLISHSKMIMLYLILFPLFTVGFLFTCCISSNAVQPRVQRLQNFSDTHSTQ